MSSEVMFKAALGGFKRTQVINYIEKLQNDFFAYRKANEENVGQLNMRISELEDELEQYKGTESTTKKLVSGNARVTDVKAVIDGLAENMNKLFEQMLAVAEGQESDLPYEHSEPFEEDIAKEVEQDTEQTSEAVTETKLEPQAEHRQHRYDDDDEQSFNEQIKKLISEYGTL